MPPGPHPDEPTVGDLRAELAAERAAADHWRRVAEQRSTEYAALRHRRFVRAVLALERRLAPLRRPVGTVARRRRALADRSALALRAIGRSAGRRVDELQSVLQRLPTPPAIDRSLTLVVVGSSGTTPPTATDADTRVRVVHIEPAADVVTSVRDAITAADTDLLAILLATSQPLDASWLARLAAAVTDDVVASTAVMVHPRRRPTNATAHDGRVRAAGLSLDTSADLVPEVHSIGAGRAAEVIGPPADVDAASAACVVVERTAFHEAGGLPRTEDLDVAVVELCVQLRARGGRIAVVPGAVLLDHRPVTRFADLRSPIDPGGEPWRQAVERSGPALLRATRPLDPAALRFAITCSPPSRKVARRWGDWHLATGLAAALQRQGHQVRLQTAAEADHPAGRACDVHVVVRGLQPVRRTSGQRHVVWIISHPESIDDADLDAADLVLVASPRFAEHLRARCTTPVHVFLQATDHHRFWPRPVDPTHRHDVTVVAKTRDVVRPVVADAITAGLAPSIYGGGWSGLVDQKLIVADHVDNEQLPIIYSSARVVLNDHWATMQAWGFVSNRLFDVLACGTPVISDPVAGVAELFDGVVTEYRTPAELREAVERVLADQVAARADAERAREIVVDNHTFDHRAARLIELLGQI